MSAEKLIRQLEDKLGISDLNMTEDNTCWVIFDSDDVLFECSHGNLFIVSEIGRVEEEEKEPRIETQKSRSLQAGAHLPAFQIFWVHAAKADVEPIPTYDLTAFTSKLSVVTKN